MTYSFKERQTIIIIIITTSNNNNNNNNNHHHLLLQHNNSNNTINIPTVRSQRWNGTICRKVSSLRTQTERCTERTYQNYHCFQLQHRLLTQKEKLYNSPIQNAQRNKSNKMSSKQMLVKKGKQSSRLMNIF